MEGGVSGEVPTTLAVDEEEYSAEGEVALLLRGGKRKPCISCDRPLPGRSLWRSSCLRHRPIGWRTVTHVHQVDHVDHVFQVDYPSEVPTKEQHAMALMQVREAAQALGVSENTIRRWEERGLIPAVRLPSGVRRFRPEDIEAAKARMYEGLPPLVEGDDVVSVSKATPID